MHGREAIVLYFLIIHYMQHHKSPRRHVRVTIGRQNPATGDVADEVRSRHANLGCLQRMRSRKVVAGYGSSRRDKNTVWLTGSGD